MAVLERSEVEIPNVGPVRIHDDKTIDFLVGHAPTTTRAKAYVPPSEKRLRAAVDSLPGIDFRRDAVDNVVALHG